MASPVYELNATYTATPAERSGMMPSLCASVIGTTDDDATAPAQIAGAPIGSASVADFALKQV